MNLMYRCYFMRRGRVSHGCSLKVITLDAAIATGRKILHDELDPDDWDGFEIWLDSGLLYRYLT
jgi:hypothetical protein